MLSPITRSHSVVAYSTVYVTVTSSEASTMMQKRAPKPIAAPLLQARQYTNSTTNTTTTDAMNAFASALSSGCSCLNIPISTTTMTSTAATYVGDPSISQWS